MIAQIFLALFSLTIFAQAPECDQISSQLGKDLTLTNCATEEIEKSLKSNPGDSKIACKCAEDYKRKLKIFGTPVNSNPSFVKDKLLDELKKALTENINYILKLRVIPIKNDYQAAIGACNLDSLIRDCGNDSGLSPFRDSITNEIAHLISTERSLKNDGTVDRKMSENSCNVSDSAILQAQSLILDEQITDELVEKMKKADLSTVASIQAFLNNSSKNAPLSSLFKSHPILGPLLQKPDAFKAFFTSIKSPVSANFKQNLYENKSLAQEVDKRIANSCEKAISSYRNVACTGNGSPKKMKFNSLIGLDPLINSEGFRFDEESIDLTNSNPKSLKTTEDIVDLCSSISTDESAIDIRPYFESLKPLIDPNFQKMSYSEYRKNKYDKDFNGPRQNLCPLLNPPCTSNEYSCRLANLISDPKNQALASSTDPGMQKLLRSFVGDKPSLSTSPATRDILIAQGVWPKSDGSYVAQKSVPERKSNYFTELASATPETNTTLAATGTNQAFPERNQLASRRPSQTAATANNNQNAASNSQASNTYRPESREIDQADLDELRRKVEDLKDSPTSTKEQKVANAPTTTPTRVAQNTTQRSAIGSSFAQALPDPASVPAVAAAPSLPSQSSDNRDTRDPQQLAAQASQARMNQALAGMAGARGASGSQSASALTTSNDLKDRAPASESDAQGTLITKVLDSSQLQNLNTLAQQKRDFVFQINTSTFKITFDQAAGVYNAQLTSPRTEDSDVLKHNLLQYLNRSAQKSGRLNSLQQAFKTN